MLLILAQLMLLHLQFKAKTLKEKREYLRWGVYLCLGVITCAAISTFGPKLLDQ